MSDLFGESAIANPDLFGDATAYEADLFGDKIIDNAQALMNGKSNDGKPGGFVNAIDARFGQGRNMIILLIGRRGEGKTAFQTTMVDIMMKKYEASGFPGRIFSNYLIRFLRKSARGYPIDYYNPFLIDQVSDFPSWLKDGFMVLDEVHSFASGRRALSRSNMDFSLFLTQIRHRNIECMWTTQFPQVLDPQALLQVDLFVRVNTIRRYPPNGRGDAFPRIMKLSIFDYWGVYTGKDYRKPWPPQPKDVDATRYVLIPQWMAGQYDTSEIITSSYWSDAKRDQIVLQEQQRMGLHPPSTDLSRAEDLGRAAAGDGDPDALAGILPLIKSWPRATDKPLRLERHLDKARQLSNGIIETLDDLVDYVNQHPHWRARRIEQPTTGRVIYQAFYQGEA